ncbi:hypothetical protein M0812_08177 [Anaeramoeba flamelloides]|uniref:Uncharacterized protein n=1 Tax=Anaeramoeba flamelloides TaxID=1746091 RepID=A0AAV7ZWP4_9EUKA|nr:hypothetical protein M0812_08177 [Anaeramoeba flamelloides]
MSYYFKEVPTVTPKKGVYSVKHFNPNYKTTLKYNETIKENTKKKTRKPEIINTEIKEMNFGNNTRYDPILDPDFDSLFLEDLEQQFDSKSENDYSFKNFTNNELQPQEQQETNQNSNSEKSQSQKQFEFNK